MFAVLVLLSVSMVGGGGGNDDGGSLSFIVLGCAILMVFEGSLAGEAEALSFAQFLCRPGISPVECARGVVNTDRHR